MSVFTDWLLRGVNARLDHIELLITRGFNTVITKEGEISMTGQELIDKVANQTTVIGGMKTIEEQTNANTAALRDKIQQLIDQGGSVTPEQLQQVADVIDQNTAQTQQISDDLASALVTNTAAASEK